MPPQDSNAVGGRKMNFALLLIFWLVPLVAFYVHHRSELEKVHSRVDYLISRQEDRMISNNNYHLDLPVEDSGRVLIEAQSSFTYAANYGVVGDATIDDTSAIQSALDSAGSGASGGTVILPKGIFKTTSPLRIPGGVTLKARDMDLHHLLSNSTQVVPPLPTVDPSMQSSLMDIQRLFKVSLFMTGGTQLVRTVIMSRQRVECL